MQDGKGHNAQPFGDHIRELRQRLFYCVIVLMAGCAIGYTIHDRLFYILRRPLHAQLYYTTPTGGFNAIIKISIMFGLFITIPVFIYQLGKFLSPAFKHRYKLWRIVLYSAGLAVIGVLFAYYMSLPAALHFLSNISAGNLQPLITINEYLGFVFAYLTSFALLFQLPLVLLFINRIKPQSPGTLMKYERWVILFSFILAAILTPTPDPINQTIMALPLILLYQFSVVLIWLVNKKSRPAVAEETVVGVPDEPNTAPPLPSLTAYSSSSYSGTASFPATMPQSSNMSSNSNLISDVYNTS